MKAAAWSYLVVSSDAQVDTLEDQQRWAAEIAASNGWTITRTFRGVSSGAKGTRELLVELLTELRSTSRQQRPGRILMIRLDRTGRGVGIDALAAIAEIRELGVLIHTREDGDVRIERAADTLVPFMRILTGALENEARSDKWKAVHARRRAAGLHIGVVPFGVVLIDGKAAPYEPEAAVVREMFALAAAGWGYTRLARWAKERAPTKRQSDGTDKPLHWAPSSVKSILWGSTVRAALIDDESIQRMEAARRTDFRARAQKRWPWPLHGAIRCICGKMLSGHCSGESKYRIRYYICRWHGGNGAYPSHRADDLEESFMGILRRLAAKPGLVLKPEHNRSAEALQARESAARSRLETLDRRRRRACELAEDRSLSGPQLRERLDEIDADRKVAREELERARTERAALAQYAKQSTSLKKTLANINVEKAWASASVETQQEIARVVATILGGLYASPSHRGHISLHGAKQRKSDDSITKKFIQSITE